MITAHPEERVKGRQLGAGAVITVLGAGGGLVLNLLTGVIQARTLGTDGRGVVALVVAWAFMWQFIVNLGFREGLVHLQSNDAGQASIARRLGVASAAVLGMIGFAVAQVFIGVGFRAQESDIVTVARYGMLLIPAILLYETMTSLAAASQRFVFFGLGRLAQPVVFAATLVVLLAVGSLTVSSALAAFGLSYLLSGVGIWVILRTSDQADAPARPDLQVKDSAATASRFGLRSFGHGLGGAANARLDLMLMSAVLVAAQAGIYQVAVSIASIVAGLFMPLRHIIFAASARQGGDDAVQTVASMTRITLLLATAISAVLAIAAPTLVTLIYGDAFRESATTMRFLLPGIVLWTAAGIVAGGLNARDLPGRASTAQILGALVTVIGLLLFLRPYGITGAAAVSSFAYGTVFVASTHFYLQSTKLSLGEFLSPRHLSSDVTTILTSIRGSRLT